MLQLAERDLASFASYFPGQGSRRRNPVTISPVVSAKLPCARSAFDDTKESSGSKRPRLSRTSFVALNESKTDIVRGFSFIAAANLEESGS